MITTSDSLQYIKSKGDYEFNIIYADPPYALGSEVYIRPDGKVDYSKANDFMSKWEMPTGEYWEAWFKEAFRTLKYGGYLILFGIDRQTLLFKYYALLSGFQEKQSLYWYFISNFPKATDLSKMIDKQEGRMGDGELKRQELAKYIGEKVKEKYNNEELAKILGRSEKSAFIHHWVSGRYIPMYEELQKLRDLIDLPNDKLLIWEEVTKEAEREIIGSKIVSGDETTAGGYSNGVASIDGKDINIKREIDITTPSTDLAKKYDGYKYSIAPLKQTNETIMVFMKPTKTGSPLHDTLAYESGDTTINVSALDIDGNRVGTEKMVEGRAKNNSDNSNAMSFEKGKVGYSDNFKENEIPKEYDGRYPSQTFIDNEAAQVLDEQSDITKGAATVNKYGSPSGSGIYAWNNTDEKPSDNIKVDGYNDIGGASKILHKCNYEQDDLTLYHYEPKVGNGERNAGLGGFVEQQYSHDGRDKPIENAYQRNDSVAKNNHPTLKPIDLNYRILKLFKTPDTQKILYPFAGSGSEIIGGIKAGFDNWVGCEINADYVEIANARIKYWKETMWEQQSLFGEI